MVIREGKAEDLESVTDLCHEVDFFGKLDFMPGMWLQDVQNSKRIVVVAEKNNKVVCTSCMLKCY